MKLQGLQKVITIQALRNHIADLIESYDPEHWKRSIVTFDYYLEESINAYNNINEEKYEMPDELKDKLDKLTS